MLAQRKPLRRRKTITPKRRRPRRSGRVRDNAYLRAVKSLPCLLAPLNCTGPVEADHAGQRPLGRKCSDDEAIALCRGHHRERTDYAGFFKGWSGHAMRAWCDFAIEVTRRQLGREAA